MKCLFLNILDDLLKAWPYIIVRSDHSIEYLAEFGRVSCLELIEGSLNDLKVKALGFRIEILEGSKVRYFQYDHSQDIDI